MGGGFKKFQRFRVKELLLCNRMEAFFENFHQKWKNASCGAQFRYLQIKYVKNRSVRLKILTYECPMQSYIKNRVKLWEQTEFKCERSVSTVFLGTSTDFRCILHSVRLQK